MCLGGKNTFVNYGKARVPCNILPYCPCHGAPCRARHLCKFFSSKHAVICITMHWDWFIWEQLLWCSAGAHGVDDKPLLLGASRRCCKPVQVLVIQCPFSLNADLYSCCCVWFLPGFSWPHAAAQPQINKELCWQLLPNLLASFRDLFSPCAQGVGCRRPRIASGVCFPVQFWPVVLSKSVFFLPSFAN